MKLDQGWQFRQAGEEKWYPAQVPGEVHTDLLRQGLIADPFYRDNESTLQWIGKTDWEYQTRFTVAAGLRQRENVELVFAGLDTYADVFLNDSLILRADNMFREWRVACKSLLRAGENTLRVHFRSPINEVLPRMAQLSYQLPAVNDHGEKTSPYTRKAPYHFGWDWGPRFVTSGIWQPVLLEAWEEARVVDLQIIQNQLTEKSARLTAAVEIHATRPQQAEIRIASAENAFPPQTVRCELTPGVQTHRLDFTIANPRLWWPNGMGEQPLYTIHAQLQAGGKNVGQASRRVGLRTVELWQQPDAWGRSFEFIVNGVPVFAKGGNWIPADNFLNRIDAARYAHLLHAVQAANMNMLRVWGGGIYENEKFYELCDELGLMVWQDFMFACSMYPAQPADLANLEQEAIHQVKRLRNHPSLVLWCGNNEVEAGWKGWGWQQQCPDSVWQDYLKIFHGVLPKVCATYDPARPYWPSSPTSYNQEDWPGSPNSGDMHYWGVWHGAEPFAAYLQQTPRFMSEYGFQSFPQLKTIKQFALPEDYDLASPVMVTHQKHGRGNELIRTYTLREFLEPKDFASFLYVSQIVQAEGLKLGTEHLRRLRPRCMGALYWQIDDCWPVASWSSIDYYGRWKALHYFARRFFSPILVSPHHDSTKVEVYIVSDERAPEAATLHLSLIEFNGKVLRQEERPVWVRALSSTNYFSFNKNEWLPAGEEQRAFLLAELRAANGEVLSANTLLFKPVKELRLPSSQISKQVTATANGFQITLAADQFASHVFLTADEHEGFFTDNYFHLVPGRPVTVEFQTEGKIALADFERSLQVKSLTDAFAAPLAHLE